MEKLLFYFHLKHTFMHFNHMLIVILKKLKPFFVKQYIVKIWE